MSDQTIKQKWWLEPSDGDAEDMAAAIASEVERIDALTIGRQQRMLTIAAMYGDTSDWPHAGLLFEHNPLSNELSHNLVPVAVDTLCSEVTQTTPAPMAVPNGGDYDTLWQADQLNSYWECEFERQGVRDLAPLVMRDGILYGQGCVRIDAEVRSGRILFERFFPQHLLVDDISCTDVAPREFYLTHAVDKDALCERFPTMREQIKEAAPPSTFSHFGHWGNGAEEDANSTVAGVTEVWRVASSDGAGDGKFAIALSNCVLLFEDYDYKDPPIAFLRPSPPQRGWWGELMVERIKPAQRDLNKHLLRLQDAMHLRGRVMLGVSQQDADMIPRITNEVGTILPFKGGPPQVIAPPSLPSDVYMHLDRLREYIFEAFGLNRGSATGMIPSGLRSGRAQLVYNDTQSRRFVNIERGYESWHTKCARLLVRAEKRLAKAGVKRQVSVKSYGVRRAMPWSEVELATEVYNVLVMPASALPSSPAGRIEMLQQWRQTGIIDDEQMWRVADIPDLRQVRDEHTAGRQIAEWHVDGLLRGKFKFGDECRPLPEMNLQATLQISQRRLLLGMVAGAKPERVAELRKYMTEVGALILKSQQLAPPMSPPAMAMPHPPGGAPPQPIDAPPIQPGA